MTLRKLTMVPMLAMALFAVGCGDDCVSVCEDTQECADLPDELKTSDCDKFCEDLQKDAEDAGCEDQYDDLWSCAGDQDDVCKESDACNKEGEAFTKCMLE